MSLTLTLTPAACKKAYKMFGEALTNEIARNFERFYTQQSGEVQECPKEVTDILSDSLESLLQKVGKKEKTQKEKKPKKKSAAQKKKDLGIRKRFQYKGEDQKGVNGAFLRIRVDRETRIVSMINEANWSPKSKKNMQKFMVLDQPTLFRREQEKRLKLLLQNHTKRPKKHLHKLLDKLKFIRENFFYIFKIETIPKNTAIKHHIEPHASVCSK